MLESTKLALKNAPKKPQTEAQRMIARRTLQESWKKPDFIEKQRILAKKRIGVKRPAHVVAALVACHKGKKLSGDRLEKTRESQKKAIEAAKEWHKSEHGRIWHKENGKKNWEKRVWHPIDCQECGIEFKTPYKNKTKYCSVSCKNNAYKKKRSSL